MKRNDDRPEGGSTKHDAYAEGDLPEQPMPGEVADPAAPDVDLGDATDVDILRAELRTAVDAVDGLTTQLREAEERFMRARAEQDTMRRRMLGEVELARAEGVTSALSPSLNVFDDLERALDAADRTDDPRSIVPGVRAVRDALLRNLAALDVKLVGAPGERFDPNLHEALTVVQLRPGAEPGTIDQVFEAGFVRGDHLVRVARVTVFADEGR